MFTYWFTCMWSRRTSRTFFIILLGYVTHGQSLTVAKGFSPLKKRKGSFAILVSLRNMISSLETDALKIKALLEIFIVFICSCLLTNIPNNSVRGMTHYFSRINSPGWCFWYRAQSCHSHWFFFIFFQQICIWLWKPTLCFGVKVLHKVSHLFPQRLTV